MLSRKPLSPTASGALAGLLTSCALGFVYIVLLREPPSAFYLFAAPALLGGPLLAGLVAARRTRRRRLRAALAASGAALGGVWALFILIYALAIRLETRRVAIPAFCDGTYAMEALPSERSYALPDGTRAILVLRDAQAAVVATVDQAQPARPTTLFLISSASETVLGSITFPNDIVAVAMDERTAYLFHEGIGHAIRKDTGKYEPFFLTMDAYGPNLDGSFETTGVFSSWSRDGSVKLRPLLFFHGIARGCHIDGDTERITKL